jgi:Rad3-related DNA helicase
VVVPCCTCAQVLVSTPAAYMHLDHSKLGPDKFSIIVFDEAHHVIKKVSAYQSCPYMKYTRTMIVNNSMLLRNANSRKALHLSLLYYR